MCRKQNFLYFEPAAGHSSSPTPLFALSGCPHVCKAQTTISSLSCLRVFLMLAVFVSFCYRTKRCVVCLTYLALILLLRQNDYLPLGRTKWTHLRDLTAACQLLYKYIWLHIIVPTNVEVDET